MARSVARVILQYECLRLESYRSRPGNPDRIDIRRIGAVRALRFPVVGYFNQAQGLGDAEAERLDEIEAYYADLARGHKILVAPDAARAVLFANLAGRGFAVAYRDPIWASPASARTSGA